MDPKLWINFISLDFFIKMMKSQGGLIAYAESNPNTQNVRSELWIYKSKAIDDVILMIKDSIL